MPVLAGDIDASAVGTVRDHHLVGGEVGGDAPLLEGQYFVDKLPSGLVVHCNDSTSRSDFESRFVAPPGLNVTILLSGRLEVELAGDVAVFEIEEHDPGAAAVLWIAHEPIQIVRRVRKRERVRKVSLCLGTDWFSKWEETGAHAPESLFKLVEDGRKWFQWTPSERIVRNAAQIIAHGFENTLAGKLLVERSAIDITYEVLRSFDDPAGIEGPSARDSSQGRKVYRFIEENIHADQSLAQLAASVGMSVSSMQRVFKRCYGMTVGDFIRSKRLEAARSALLFDGATVAQAAELAGYRSASNFTHAFLRRYGELPSRTRS